MKQADEPKADSLIVQTQERYGRFDTVSENEGQSSAMTEPGGIAMDEDIDMVWFLAIICGLNGSNCFFFFWHQIIVDTAEAEAQSDNATQDALQAQKQSSSSEQQRSFTPNNLLSSRHPYGRLWLERSHYAYSDPLINLVPATPADSLQSLHQNSGQAVASSLQNPTMLSPHYERKGTPPLLITSEDCLSSMYRKRVITFGPRSNCEKCKLGERHFIHYDYQ